MFYDCKPPRRGCVIRYDYSSRQVNATLTRPVIKIIGTRDRARPVESPLQSANNKSRALHAGFFETGSSVPTAFLARHPGSGESLSAAENRKPTPGHWRHYANDDVLPLENPYRASINDRARFRTRFLESCTPQQTIVSLQMSLEFSRLRCDIKKYIPTYLHTVKNF